MGRLFILRLGRICDFLNRSKSQILPEQSIYWQQTDKQILQRINLLIHEIQRQPFTGIGKPEPLKHGLAGYWSRRITDEHRIVYNVENAELRIAQLRYHY